MSSGLFDRRSERFAQLLDEAEGRRRTHRRSGLDGELGDLVTLAVRTGQVSVAPEPDPEFRTGLREMLMAKIERDGIGATAVERAAHAANRAALAGKTQPIRQVQTGAGRTRAAVLIGVTAGALALSGVSAASTKALPGDSLYPVKLSSERAQLALAGSDVSRGKLRLEFARVRLSEAREVAADRVPEVLRAMDAETATGVRLLTTAAVAQGDVTVLQIIGDFVERQRDTLDQLRASAGRPATAHSYELLSRIEKRAKDLRTALRKDCLIRPLDELGPNPEPC